MTMIERYVFWSALALLLIKSLPDCGICGMLLPFAAAYVASRILRPAGLTLSRRLHLPERVGCAAFAVLACTAGAYLLALLTGILAAQLREVLEALPMYAGKITELCATLFELFPFNTDTEVLLSLLSDALTDAASSLGAAAAAFFANVIGAFSGGIFSTIVTVFALIYLTADPSGIAESIRWLVPHGVTARVEPLLQRIAEAIFLYIRVYLVIISITFAELTVGLTVLGVSYAPAKAFLIAIVDALPVLGCGCVLVPWAIWELLYGARVRGVALLVLLALVYLLRQLLDSRLIGRMTGVHPFVALACLYLGWHIDGVIGMLLSPILLCVVCSLKRRSAETTEGERGGLRT